MDLRLTHLSIHHAAEAVDVARDAGWKDTVADWRAILTCGRALGHRDETGRLVSTGVLCDFGPVVALAKMIVRGEVRRRGLGRELVAACIAARPDPSAVTALVATPFGRPLYESFGFQAVAGVEVLVGPPRRQVARQASAIAPLVGADTNEAFALDQEAMGCDRARMLEARLPESRAAFVARDPRGIVVGFALAVEQRDLLLIGPLVSANVAFAFDLFDAAISGWDGRVRVDVPTEQTAMIEALVEAGLECAASRPEMTLAGAPLPGRRALRFGLASQAYG